jgi:hypothetical protein
MTGIIHAALHEHAANSSRVWATDRSQTVGASEVGQCARKVFWLKNEGDATYGAPRDDGYMDSWGARVRGSVYEDQFWYPALKAKFGSRLKFAGPDQKTFVSGFLSATPDGLLVGMTPGEVAPGSGVEVMAECKTVDPRTNLTEAKAENVYQTHVQMGIVRELTDYRPTHSLLSYTDASFWSEITEFVIEFDQKIYDTAKARAAQIMTATSAADLKPEGWIAGGRECGMCPFSAACGIARRSLPSFEAPADPQFTAEATDIALSIKQAERRRDLAEEQVRSLQDELKGRLRAKGVRKIPGVLSWFSVKGRETYDNRAIREAAAEAGIDVESMKNTGEPTDRLTISVKPSISEGAETKLLKRLEQKAKEKSDERFDSTAAGNSDHRTWKQQCI